MTLFKAILFIFDSLTHFAAIIVLLHFVTLIIINRLIISNYKILISTILFFVCAYILHIYIQSVDLFSLVYERPLFIFIDSIEGISRVVLTIGFMYYAVFYKFTQGKGCFQAWSS
jgi:hypothetical protein